MAHNLKVSTTVANAAMGDGTNKGVAPLYNGGVVRIYDGAQPADPSVAVSTQTLLATLTLNATAFAAAVAGVLTANAITAGTAVAASTATWFRALKSDGVTALHDGSVGTSNADMVIPNTAIVVSEVITCSAFTLTFPNP